VQLSPVRTLNTGAAFHALVGGTEVAVEARVNMTRRVFIGAAATAAVAAGAAVPSFEASKDVRIAVPEKAIEDSFRIAVRLVQDMRRLAYQQYGKDGLLAVSDGKNGPQHSYDPRDFHFGPKCAAYLYGHDKQYSVEMGRRLFQDQSDPADGRLKWDPKGQTAIHFAQTAKYWSDFVAYTEQDATVAENWGRILQTIKWCMATYDPNGDGLVEHGENVPNHFWALLVGEPENFPLVNSCNKDVVTVATMDVCELLRVMGAHASEQGLAGSEWLQSHAAQTHEAIETSAWDPDAGYYYLLYRRPEKRWQHSILRLNEDSRELDVTPYYSALISGNHARAQKVAEYARKVLLTDDIFPMPLQYPPYSWISPHYGGADTFVEGGCWEESYYNCVRSWSECKMLDALYEAIRRRSEAYARDGDCIEWYTQRKGIARGRDRYGISAAAHVSAVIEGLFGITPAKIGFKEINIHPNLPATWTDQTSSVRVTLPNDGFLEYSHLYDTAKRTLTLKVSSNTQRTGHFRVFAPMPVVSVKWNSVKTLYDSAQLAGGGFFVFLDRPFQEGQLEINMTPRS
jgi:hypothetical protein